MPVGRSLGTDQLSSQESPDPHYTPQQLSPLFYISSPSGPSTCGSQPSKHHGTQIWIMSQPKTPSLQNFKLVTYTHTLHSRLHNPLPYQYNIQFISFFF